MNRRKALTNALISAGALISLPSWAYGWKINELLILATRFNKIESEILSSVADTIIPADSSGIGAIGVGVDKFLLSLFDRCYEKEIQQNIQTQLLNLNSKALNLYKQVFTSCSQDQRLDLLNQMALSEEKPISDFFKLIKSETIRGFNTSEIVMTKYLNYKIAPGYYRGCVDVNA